MFNTTRSRYRCARFPFADRLRAGAGRRSGSGRRPGRVRPEGAASSESSAGTRSVPASAPGLRLLSRPPDSVVARSCGRAGVWAVRRKCLIPESSRSAGYFWPTVASVPSRPRRLLAASSSAQRQWRSLGARSMLDALSFMISTLRSQVGFAAAVAHARLRLSRLELIGGSGRSAAPPAVTHLPRAPSFRRPPSSRRGEALWERVEAGSGLLGAAFSESAAGSGR